MLNTAFRANVYLREMHAIHARVFFSAVPLVIGMYGLHNETDTFSIWQNSISTPFT